MQKARSQARNDPKIASTLLPLVGMWFQALFHSPLTPRTGVLFTCPSRYSFTIGHTGVFSLGGWSPRLHARLLGARALLRKSTSISFGLRVPGSHRLWPSVPGEFR